MEGFYGVLFALLSALCLVLEWPRAPPPGKAAPAAKPAAFTAFRNNYLFVYSLMMAGDWLQGPYVYALYAAYGFDKGDIGRLFIAGFGSSMVFGTIVGSLGDKYGRKNASLLYCVTYGLSCATKHWNSYRVLMVGRVLGGVATSLLFTAFESWLVSEHMKRGYEPAWLSGTFSKAVFLGNGLVAILAGLIANSLVTGMELGPTAPFDAAAAALALGFAVIASTWTENFGAAHKGDPKGSSPSADNDAEASTPDDAPPLGAAAASRQQPAGAAVSAFVSALATQFRVAADAITSDPKVGLLGAMQSLFEASMYSFVFLWTPALSPADEDLPHGMIFATFMLSSMIGSSIASRLLLRVDTRPEVFMQRVFGIAAAALAVPVLVAASGVGAGPQWARAGTGSKQGGMTLGGQIQFLAFNVFEGCVGVFWPSMMKMRSQYVPEDVRSTIMNMFRIPLNLFVCVILYNVSLFPLWFMFSMCAAFLGAAAVAQRRLERLTAASAAAARASMSDGAGEVMMGGH